MNEKEYKDYIYKKASAVETRKDLDKLLKEVIADKDLDYGKTVYAISSCMMATLNYVDRNLGGISGFQAGCIGWEMVKKYLVPSNKTSLKIIDYDKMLYPQYEYEFVDKEIPKELWTQLQKEANRMLAEVDYASPQVIEHWKSIVAGIVPFGYKVKK